jgi:hypothetical protein
MGCIERGESNVTLGTLLTMAERLKISLDKLFAGIAWSARSEICKTSSDIAHCGPFASRLHKWQRSPQSDSTRGGREEVATDIVWQWPALSKCANESSSLHSAKERPKPYRLRMIPVLVLELLYITSPQGSWHRGSTVLAYQLKDNAIDLKIAIWRTAGAYLGQRYPWFELDAFIHRSNEDMKAQVSVVIFMLLPKVFDH